MRKNKMSMMVVIQVAMPVDGLSWRPSKGGRKVSCIGGVRSPTNEILRIMQQYYIIFKTI